MLSNTLLTPPKQHRRDSEKRRNEEYGEEVLSHRAPRERMASAMLLGWTKMEPPMASHVSKGPRSQLYPHFIASSIALQKPIRAWDIAPTILDLLGFPLSEEMPGHALTTTSREPRIATYGARASGGAAQGVNEEYYENLRSLGYIR